MSKFFFFIFKYIYIYKYEQISTLKNVKFKEEEKNQIKKKNL